MAKQEVTFVPVGTVHGDFGPYALVSKEVQRLAEEGFSVAVAEPMITEKDIKQRILEGEALYKQAKEVTENFGLDQFKSGSFQKRPLFSEKSIAPIVTHMASQGVDFVNNPRSALIITSITRQEQLYASWKMAENMDQKHIPWYGIVSGHADMGKQLHDRINGRKNTVFTETNKEVKSLARACLQKLPANIRAQGGIVFVFVPMGQLMSFSACLIHDAACFSNNEGLDFKIRPVNLYSEYGREDVKPALETQQELKAKGLFPEIKDISLEPSTFLIEETDGRFTCNPFIALIEKAKKTGHDCSRPALDTQACRALVHMTRKAFQDFYCMGKDHIVDALLDISDIGASSQNPYPYYVGHLKKKHGLPFVYIQEGDKHYAALEGINTQAVQERIKAASAGKAIGR